MISNSVVLISVVGSNYLVASGAHTLSGAVLEPRALQELFPDWKERGVGYCIASVLSVVTTAFSIGTSTHSNLKGQVLHSHSEVTDPSTNVSTRYS